MSDLTIHGTPVCESCEDWQATINDDWSCKAYKFGQGKPCKHIEEAKPSRCGWNNELEVRPYTRVCPDCGAPTRVVQVGA